MGDNYADLERVKASINDTGATVDNDKLDDYADQIDSILGSEFIYILGDVLPFQSVPDWFVDMATNMLEAFYWFKENGEKDQYEACKKDMLRIKANWFMNPPSMTR